MTGTVCWIAQQGALSRSQQLLGMAAAQIPLLLLALSAARIGGAAATPAAMHPKYLYVWAGASPNITTSKDAMFVLDVNPESSKFGSLVKTVYTPYKGLEPHHCSVSSDGRWLGAGGLLSVLTPGLPSVLFFDLRTNPASPKLIAKSQQPVNSSVADEFVATPSGGFMVTMMGSAHGAAPGAVAEYDRNLKLVGEHVSAPGQDTFNPHGVGVDFSRKVMVTADYVLPASTLNAVPGPVLFRPTVRIWDMATTPYKVTKTLNATKFAAAGQTPAMMDVITLGDTGKFYATDGLGQLLLVDPAAKPSASFSVAFHYPVASITLGRAFRNGTRVVLAVYSASKVLLLDTTHPAKAVLLDEAYMGAGAGGHVVKVSNDNGDLIAVCTYFLEEDANGKVHAPGDQSVYFFTTDQDATKLMPHPVKPKVDFRKLVKAKGAYRPHGMAFSHV